MDKFLAIFLKRIEKQRDILQRMIEKARSDYKMELVAEIDI